MNISNLSPAEVLNYVEMPEPAYTAIQTLLDDVITLEKDNAVLENNLAEIEYIYEDFEKLLNNPKNKNNLMLEDLIKLSNRIYLLT